MKIIISPAKTMKAGTGQFRDLPRFLDRTEVLLDEMKEKSTAQLVSVYRCSEKIAAENAERFADMNLRENLMAAAERFTGLQYRHLGWDTLDESGRSYLQDHLRILCAFYGILKPYDGIVSYRMDMLSRVEADGAADLYGFWNDRPAESLHGETIINLASGEFADMVLPYLEKKNVITCGFCREKDGKRKMQSTLAKSARGEMVRWMAENRIENPADLKGFDRLNLRFDPEYSDAHHFSFTEQK